MKLKLCVIKLICINLIMLSAHSQAAGYKLDQIYKRDVEKLLHQGLYFSSKNAFIANLENLGMMFGYDLVPDNDYEVKVVNWEWNISDWNTQDSTLIVAVETSFEIDQNINLWKWYKLLDLSATWDLVADIQCAYSSNLDWQCVYLNADVDFAGESFERHDYIPVKEKSSTSSPSEDIQFRIPLEVQRILNSKDYRIIG